MKKLEMKYAAVQRAVDRLAIAARCESSKLKQARVLSMLSHCDRFILQFKRLPPQIRQLPGVRDMHAALPLNLRVCRYYDDSLDIIHDDGSLTGHRPVRGYICLDVGSCMHVYACVHVHVCTCLHTLSHTHRRRTTPRMHICSRASTHMQVYNTHTPLHIHMHVHACSVPRHWCPGTTRTPHTTAG